MKSKPVILLVDDQLQNIELLEAHLEPQGYEIIPAGSGAEALEKLSGNQIDLVLLDVIMPRMSGFEVLAKLRADKKTRRIPVIMITAHTENEERVKALESGCDDFISKPFDRHELLARVKSLLRIKFLNDEVDEAREFAESFINTVREPLIALDQDLRVVMVSRSFYEFFKVKPEETVGQLIYDLGNKQWDIPKLRDLLETILPQKTAFDNYEVEHDFAVIGRRIMLLNARQIQRVLGKERIILLAIEDVTERRQAEDKIQHMALHDSLTGLPNRRSFSAAILLEGQRARREKAPLSAIMCDIDRFKDYNDLNGHAVGDECLVKVAQAIAHTLNRSGDFCARYGGEEFVVILPNTDSAAVLLVSDKIREAVQALGIVHERSLPLKVVTLSLGVATMEEGSELSEGELVNRADMALYKAKEGGRNRVEAFLQNSGPTQ